MRLLVCTQAADKNDPALGFFHRWVEELSHQWEFVTVICLKEGEHAFPDNVKVLSLGKESGSSRISYISKFFRYIWSERASYDSVFVHMNQEYVILGGILWKMLGKKVGLWRNHPEGSFLTDLAVCLADVVFCTSPKSYTARFKKTRLMPAGIDVSLYGNPSAERARDILFLGRISPVKNVQLFVDGLKALDLAGTSFHADIIGSPANPDDVAYESEVKQSAADLVDKGLVSFCPGVAHDETAKLYPRYSLYVNLTPDGSLDKTMLEAMASKTPVLVSNSAFEGHIPELCQIKSAEPEALNQKITALMSLSEEEKASLGLKLRHYVEKHHSLTALTGLLKEHLSK